MDTSSNTSASGLRHLALKVCATSLGILVAVALGELGARLLIPVPELQSFDRLAYSERTAELARTHPHRMMHGTGWWVSRPDEAQFPRIMNLYGFRDGEWTVAKQAGATRVAFVGDSFVEGLGAADDATIPHLFARRARESGRAVEAMNFGISRVGMRSYLRLIRDLVPTFHPDHIVLVLYMNDLYDVPQDPVPLLLSGLEAERWSPWRSRLLFLLSRARSGAPVPRRWDPSPGPVKPLALDRFFAASPELAKTIERVAAPDLAAAMMDGWLNPAVVNLAARSERILPEKVAVDNVVRVLQEFLADRSVRLWLVYLPSLNQVSDAYLPAQGRISASIGVPTLTADRFQQQARDLAAAAQRHQVPFFDLTPELRAIEASGQRQYWAYDSHMRGAGYSTVADLLFDWWQSATVVGGQAQRGLR